MSRSLQGALLDAGSCATRVVDDPHLVSSTTATHAETGVLGGMLDADPSVNPDFHGWHHVWLVYCSSDMWTGARVDEAFPGTFGDGSGMLFRGAHIADAALAHLLSGIEPGGASLTDATEVLVTGSSAGSLGMVANVDRIAAALPSTARVRAVGDAGLAGPFPPTLEALVETKNTEQIAVWSSRLDGDCEAALAEPERWRCFSPYELLERGFLTTPAFFHSDQADPAFFSGYGIAPGATALRSAFAAAVRNAVATQGEGSFSPRGRGHIILATPNFSRADYDVAGDTMSDVLGRWAFERGGSLRVIEPP